MADLTSDQAIDKLRALPEDKQRAVLLRLSPDKRKDILTTLKSKSSKPAAPLKTTGEVRQSAISRFGSSYASGAGVMSKEQTKTFFTRPQEIVKGMVQAQGELGMRAGRELKSGDYVHGVTHGIEYLLPGIGPTLAHAGEQMESGDIAGGLGTTAGVATTIAADPEHVQGGLSKVGELRTSLAERGRGIARRATGAKYAAKDSVTKAAADQAENISKTREARLATAKENIRTQKEALTDIDRQKIEVAEKNKGIEAANKAQAEQVKRRGELAKQVDQGSVAAKGQLEKVEASVSKEANRRFDEVRAKIGNAEGPSDELISTVQNAEQQILQGIPENVKEFRSILKLSGESDDFAKLRQDVMSGQGMSGKYEDLAPERKAVVDDIVNRYGGELEPNKPVTWDKLQSLKSRLDARLRKTGNMNGDLKRALYSTREAVVNEMGKMAEAKGAGDLWASARDFWRQYKEDFHEATGPSGSGSPIAQALSAEDPKNIRQPFLRTQSTIGNRGTQILRKYGEHGGTEAADSIDNLLAQHKEMSGLPEKETPKPLKPTPEVFPLPGRKPLPQYPETPVVDLDAAARQSIESTARRIGHLNAWDARIVASSVIAGVLAPFIGVREGVALGASYVGMKYVIVKALEDPKVIDWISKTPPTELESLQHLPNANLVQIKATLAEMVKESKVPASPQLTRFLATGARVAATTGAANVARNPGEARDKMRQFAPSAQ